MNQQKDIHELFQVNKLIQVNQPTTNIFYQSCHNWILLPGEGTAE